MSQEAVYGFIEKVERDTDLSAIVAQAFATQSDLNLVDLAGKHGFEFTPEEGIRVWNDIQARGELPDALLECVAGGGVVNCGTSVNT